MDTGWFSVNHKIAILVTIILIAAVISSLFLASNLLSHQTSKREFYVGVEYAYGNQTSEVQALVDKVKDYTNLFVLGSPTLTLNGTNLTQICDYIFQAKLHFIVLFTSITMYDYDIFQWIRQAKQTYGEQFLGIYRFDEPGGNQLDNGPYRLINDTTTNTQTDNAYVGNLSTIVNYYISHGTTNVFTADYALNWFDYQSNYTTVFAEFVGNESRQRIIAVNRGAAEAFGKDWGAIINWKYNQPPYLASKAELLSDLSLAYSAGAKYAFVFSYPNTTQYGTLTQDHFDALKEFWDTIHNSPNSLGQAKPKVAYIIPPDYGFGFRSPADTVWGLFGPDSTSEKIYYDITNLTQKYDSQVDVFCDEPALIAPLLKNYSQVFYWNQTIT